ncbi:transcriptional regulator TraR [Rhizobium rhizogenes]|uniref:Transcriptional regulator TraR n=1 Tax=Rhizobium rhizogenes TaxID=359 RepID=A0AA88JNV9_RHIRH|nr:MULTISPECIES: transcriptional regulator TraR [Rhizobium/Agrobacterium group]KAA3497970.1 transcriptional regulator TraR [Rhizobium rhizogenes]KAA3521783.1 transcriptional regulator TraR [Agrobacterium tumefaciens]MBO0128452.1 transcriptional regulator TraR [Agrobacterium sp. OT33]
MQHWLDKLTDLAAIPFDESSFKDALAAISEQSGYSGYAFLHIEAGHIFAASNYHQDWCSIYFERKYAALDPVVKRAKSVQRIFTWSGEQDTQRLSKAERSFFSQAADFGIRSGVTIPVRTANGSISMFTLASQAPTIELQREIDPIAAAAAVAQLHARVLFLDMKPSVEETTRLDPKEAIYLRWMAVGKTMEEVADLEGVKYNSVRVKLAEAKKRFNVHTTTHLAAVAIRRKLI